MRNRLDSVIDDAVAAGILPHDAAIDVGQHRPWPVLLLTGLGAWLAAIPLFIFIFLLRELFLEDISTHYVLGVILMVLASLVLRDTARPLFIEQLAFPVLIAGLGIFAQPLFKDLSAQQALAILAVLPVLLAVEIPRQWLRILLGTAACGLMVAAGVDKAISLILHAILPAAPGEIIIIMGCAIAAFMISNSPSGEL